MKEIAVIMPTYKAHETIVRSIGSILLQTIVDKIAVYVVVDADGEDYDYLYKFSDFVELHIIEAMENGGCGVARQIGIDASKEPFILFLDTDDTFASPFAIEKLYNAITENEDSVVISGNFLEELETGKFYLHAQDFLWMHGKIYRRDFIERYNLRFNLTRANEDMGFNYKIKLIENPLERIGYLNEVVHYWHFNKNSIVRVDNAKYRHTASIEGTVVNLIDVYNLFKDKKVDERLNDMMTGAFIGMYYNYIGFKEQFDNEPWLYKWYKEFWEKVYKHIENEELEKTHFTRVTSGRLKVINNIIPDMTFKDFKELLK